MATVTIGTNTVLTTVSQPFNIPRERKTNVICKTTASTQTTTSNVDVSINGAVPGCVNSPGRLAQHIADPAYADPASCIIDCANIPNYVTAQFGAGQAGTVCTLISMAVAAELAVGSSNIGRCCTYKLSDVHSKP
jgi:hypothetical protein